MIVQFCFCRLAVNFDGASSERCVISLRFVRIFHLCDPRLYCWSSKCSLWIFLLGENKSLQIRRPEQDLTCVCWHPNQDSLQVDCPCAWNGSYNQSLFETVYVGKTPTTLDLKSADHSRFIYMTYTRHQHDCLCRLFTMLSWKWLLAK